MLVAHDDKRIADPEFPFCTDIPVDFSIADHRYDARAGLRTNVQRNDCRSYRGRNLRAKGSELIDTALLIQ